MEDRYVFGRGNINITKQLGIDLWTPTMFNVPFSFLQHVVSSSMHVFQATSRSFLIGWLVGWLVVLRHVRRYLYR
jgi:cell division protein FtsX